MKMSYPRVNKVLSEFAGRKEINGQKRKYWIEVPKEEYYEQIIQHMLGEFVDDEPLSRFAGLINCKDSIAFLAEGYRKFLKQNMALVCFTSGPDGKPTIAGMNVTLVSKKSESEFEAKGQVFTKIYNILRFVESLRDPFSALDCEEYLYAMGLYVLPDYRGEGLGLELLKAREPLCRIHGIRFTCTIFTSFISQKVAVKAGFIDLTSVPYTEIFQKRPELTIPEMLEHTKNCRLMYLEYK